MNKKIFFVSTIILFAIFCFLSFVIYNNWSNRLDGAGYSGFPLVYSSWGTSTPQGAHTFSLIYLLLDLLLYLVVAMLISLPISKFSK